MGNALPKRKPNRLENFDYGAGYSYFIKVCTKNRKNVLSKIVGEDIILPCFANHCWTAKTHYF